MIKTNKDRNKIYDETVKAIGIESNSSSTFEKIDAKYSVLFIMGVFEIVISKNSTTSETIIMKCLYTLQDL